VRSMSPKPLRGIRDYPPEEYERLEGIRALFSDLARTYGFKLMEPAPMEALETLEAKSGPAIREEIYHFKDKGGRNVGLRFDLTVGLTRYASSDRGAPLPIKLGAFGGVWRYDEPQHARYRWFYQWDIETYGCRNPEADAEMVEFTSHLLRKAGVHEHIVKVGDRRVVQEYIEKKLNYEGERAVELMRALDKVDKKDRDELRSEYASKGFEEGTLERLLEFGSIEGPTQKALKKLEEEGLDSTAQLAELCDQLAQGKAKYEVSMKVVRGIDYYTSTVYEALDLRNPELGALAGGGRYDLLPRIFSRPDLPATGVAGGVERLMMSLGGAASAVMKMDRPVYVACAGGMTNQALSIAAELRSRDVVTFTDIQRRNLGKQLEDAVRCKARKVVIVAPEEFGRGKLIVRDMDSHTEELIEKEKLSSLL